MTPVQKRQVLVDSYLQSYRQAGIRMTPQQVERQVIADCELVDAATRSGDIRSDNAKPAARQPRKRSSAIAEAQQKTGVRLLDGNVDLWRPSFMFQNPLKAGKRWGSACGRIARILHEGKDGMKYVGNCGPYAYEYETMWACFQSRNLPANARGFERNPFDGLADKDAARAFIRGVEDICDRSTGVLGSWFTK
jgi:hypothetical protein